MHKDKNSWGVLLLALCYPVPDLKRGARKSPASIPHTSTPWVPEQQSHTDTVHGEITHKQEQFSGEPFSNEDLFKGTLENQSYNRINKR